LREINDSPRAGPSILPRSSAQILSMILYGGNPDLEPEEAQTWTGVGYDATNADVRGR
jgi:iron complex outermembrane receptor protein